MSYNCLAAIVLVSSTAGLDAVPHPGVEDVRERLGDIYSRTEFQRLDDGSSWLSEFLSGIMRWLASLGVESPVLFWLLLIGCGVLVGLLVGWLVVRIRRSLGLTTGSRRTSNRAAERHRLARNYQTEAADHAAAGEFTEAIRLLFLALVHQFDESGRVLFRRSWTNREYLRLFDDRPELAENLRVFVDALDEHWYGQRPAAEEEYQRCREVFEAVAGQARFAYTEAR